MKKLFIAATLSAAAVAATPLLAQTEQKPAQTAATEGCAMGGEHRGNHEERRAEMQKRMQEMHARMGSHEGRGQGRSTQGEQEQH